MSSAILLDRLRREPVGHNPYYEFFRDSVGKGENMYHSGLGDIYSAVPDTQSGYGILTRSSSMNNTRVQLGNGVGSIFSSLFKFAKPLLKRGAKALLNIGSNVASDVLEGENIKSSFKKHIKNKVEETLPPIIASEVNKRIGSGKRKGIKKRTVRRRRSSSKKNYPALSLIA